MKSVATEAYWDSHWAETGFELAQPNHPVRHWLEEWFSNGTGKNCMEIGCYPGKFLAVLGRNGFTLNGIDSYRGSSVTLPRWLKDTGCSVGKIFEADFLDFQHSKKYDLVCSFGFIEHFSNWPEVIRQHVELTRPGGEIAIEVPNLKSPIYYSLYKLFEPKVLDNHVLESMSPEAISKVLKENGCTIKFAGYLGHFYFRFVTKHSALFKLLSGFINIFRPFTIILPRLLRARYIGVIAVKNKI